MIHLTTIDLNQAHHADTAETTGHEAGNAQH